MIQKGDPILISEGELLNYVSQDEIAIRYITNFSGIGKPFKSEFRQESNPSSRVFVGHKGDLMFKDFGDPELTNAISVIKYVQYKYNLSYQAAINKIARDFRLIKGDNLDIDIVKKRGKVKKEYHAPSNLIIKIKKRDWTVFDKEYWGSYYIPISLLERNNIKSISHVFINGFPTEFAKTHLVYSYDYYWHKDIFRRKIYQPNSEEYKWRTNSDYTIVQNYPNIPKTGDLLFIQSSYKDCMVMERLGYNAIAPNKEGSWMPDYYWKKLKERWGKIVIYWDNDWSKMGNPGLRYSQKFSEKYDVPYILNPNGKPDDISGYVQRYGLEEGKKLVDNLIKDL